MTHPFHDTLCRRGSVSIAVLIALPPLGRSKAMPPQPLWRYRRAPFGRVDVHATKSASRASPDQPNEPVPAGSFVLTNAISPRGCRYAGSAREEEHLPVIVGVPKEVKDNEYRVALTPEGARELTHAGHRVLVEDGAGEGSSLPQQRYERSGAEIVPTAKDVWTAADMILKVKEPIPDEYDLMQEGQVLFTYLHLAAGKELTEALLERRVSGVAY